MGIIMTISFLKIITYFIQSALFWKIILYVIKLAVYIIPLTLIVLSLIDLFKRDFKNNTATRNTLLLMIILSPISGSIIYMSIKNNHNLKK